ncbi:phospholipase D family protein [Paenibacillus sp. FSL R5-0407]|uniref:phospholipase D family protein n=1 Tax=Paenibacillus sp. FSL R5-0407 TaxID=2975320 RepID=UPI0030FA8E82
MGIHIISRGFGERFYNLLEGCKEQINIISPFIGRNTASSLAESLESTQGLECNLITRFYREDFIQRASSVDGLERLLHAGAKIYALQDLHSKLYIFDGQSVITGSANFTFNGFYKNHEFGMYMEQEPAFAKECSDYFAGLLNRIKHSGSWLVTQQMIDREKAKINESLPGRKGKKKDPTLVEYNNVRWGAKLEDVSGSIVHAIPAATDVTSDFIEIALKEDDSQGEQRNTGIWIKFEGNSEDRIPNSRVYLDRKRELYEHMDRTFFRRRPSGIKEGQLIFMAVVSYDQQGQGTPMIIGYAKTSGFKPNNIIGPEDRFYKETAGRYPYYVELHRGRYLNAPIKNGISLIELCRDLSSDLYPNRKRHPSEILSTHHQKSHIQITETACNYLIDKLEAQFKKYGAVSEGTYAE